MMINVEMQALVKVALVFALLIKLCETNTIEDKVSNVEESSNEANKTGNEGLVDEHYCGEPIYTITTTESTIILEADASENEVHEEHDALERFDLKAIGKRLKVMLQCDDMPLEVNKLQYGNYWLLQNIIRGDVSRNMGCAETITYTTHGDYTYVKFLLDLVKRWQGPISYAVFAPGYDIFDTLNAIQMVRNCYPDSELIRRYVSFHIYFPSMHMPPYVPNTEEEVLQWFYNCLNADERVEKLTYKNTNALTYPINVGRNIARKAANTHFIFASDVELLPSANLLPQFLNMIASTPELYTNTNYKRVFTLPIFEVEKDAMVPASKAALVEMLRTKRAVPFHLHKCRWCHLSPHQAEWLMAPADTKLRVFTVAKRQGAFISWEPIFISDNREPMFDERLTWDGLSEKRVQNFAMCLMDYEYHVLHPAFLVHSPGIKKDNTQLYGVTINPWEPLYDEVYMLTNPNHLTSQYDLLLELNYKFYLMDKTFLLKRQGTEPVSLLPYERSNMQPTLVLKENHLLYKIQKILPNG